MANMNQRGDASTIIITVIALVLLGTGVYFAYSNAQDKRKSSQPTSSATPAASSSAVSSSPSPATRTSFTTKYEKFSGSYPTSWSLQNSAIAADNTGVGPSDKLVFKSPAGTQLEILTGASQLGGGCQECKVLLEQSITVLGRQAYVNFIDTDKSNLVKTIAITDIKNEFMGLVTGKNIADPTTTSKMRPIYIAITSAESNGQRVLSPKPLDQYKDSTDIKDIISIVESLKY